MHLCWTGSMWNISHNSLLAFTTIRKQNHHFYQTRPYQIWGLIVFANFPDGTLIQSMNCTILQKYFRVLLHEWYRLYFPAVLTVCIKYDNQKYTSALRHFGFGHISTIDQTIHTFMTLDYFVLYSKNFSVCEPRLQTHLKDYCQAETKSSQAWNLFYDVGTHCRCCITGPCEATLA